MNKDYTYCEGKIIISDDVGCQRYIDYQDNIDELLAQENLIEEIENRIDKATDNMAHSIPKRFIPGHLIGTTIGIVLFLAVDYFTGLNILLNNYYLIPFVGCALSYTTIRSLAEYDKNKRRIRVFNGSAFELAYLYQELEKEKAKLEVLTEDRSRINEPYKMQTKVVDDKKGIQDITLNALRYYNKGYNDEKELKLTRKKARYGK